MKRMFIFSPLVAILLILSNFRSGLTQEWATSERASIDVRYIAETSCSRSESDVRFFGIANSNCIVSVDLKTNGTVSDVCDWQGYSEEPKFVHILAELSEDHIQIDPDSDLDLRYFADFFQRTKATDEREMSEGVVANFRYLVRLPEEYIGKTLSLSARIECSYDVLLETEPIRIRVVEACNNLDNEKLRESWIVAVSRSNSDVPIEETVEWFEQNDRWTPYALVSARNIEQSKGNFDKAIYYLDRMFNKFGHVNSVYVGKRESSREDSVDYMRQRQNLLEKENHNEE